jgi:putative endonuclease
MAYTVYAIRSKVDERIYVGFTQDVQKRFLEHNRGETKSTKGYRPWVLVYTEEVDSREEARNLEKYYKSGSGKEKLKRLLAL